MTTIPKKKFSLLKRDYKFWSKFQKEKWINQQEWNEINTIYMCTNCIKLITLKSKNVLTQQKEIIEANLKVCQVNDFVANASWVPLKFAKENALLRSSMNSIWQISAIHSSVYIVLQIKKALEK